MPRPRHSSSTARASIFDDEGIAEVRRLALELSRGLAPLSGIVVEHLSNPGRQLRARLALAAARNLGVDPSAAGWAVACELLHNATLIHDDIQDRDRERRGSPTVWARHGDAQAINAGDLLLMLPYRALQFVDASAERRWHLTQALAKRAEEVVYGQALELTLVDVGRRDWEDYARAARGKTGALIGLPVEGVAILAGRSPEAAAELGDCFREIGLLYQIQDDVQEMLGTKNRSRPGGDIAEGRVTALVCEHLRLSPHDEAWLCDVLSRDASETTPELIQEVLNRFRSSGTFDAVLERASAAAARLTRERAVRSEPGIEPLAEELCRLCLEPLESALASLEKHVATGSA